MVNQMPDGASETVQAPDHQSVAGSDLVQELIELGA